MKSKKDKFGVGEIKPVEYWRPIPRIDISVPKKNGIDAMVEQLFKDGRLIIRDAGMARALGKHLKPLRKDVVGIGWDRQASITLVGLKRDVDIIDIIDGHGYRIFKIKTKDFMP